ncbi:hypothetical protein SK128_022202, partial [Halocaridina rubra]
MDEQNKRNVEDLLKYKPGSGPMTNVLAKESEVTPDPEISPVGISESLGSAN